MRGIGRASRLAKQAARSLLDVRLRHGLVSRPRAPRPAVPIDDLASHTALVVVAHPDDEVIAAGALLGRLPRAGVICLTDGAPRRGPYARDAGFSNWPDYADARRREAAAALALLGREIAPARNLGIADQEAVFELAAATRCLADILRSGFSHVVTHAYEGGHPDHDATAFCVHAACALIAREGAAAPVLVEAPLYNGPDGPLVFNRFLPHADAGPIARFRLTPGEQERKRRMFACHATQSKVFGVFTLDEEIFRQAPRYHFAAAPHAGALGYDTFGWPITGRVWRTHAWRAMRELDLLETLA